MELSFTRIDEWGEITDETTKRHLEQMANLLCIASYHLSTILYRLTIPFFLCLHFSFLWSSQNSEGMKFIVKPISICICLILCITHIVNGQDIDAKEEIIQQINATGQAVREAFKQGDVETIKLYHHPDVIKALSYNNLQVGREAVLLGLRETMTNFELEFLDEKEEEVFHHQGDIVIQQMKFALRLIPKNGDDPFVFRGRTLIVLQRYEKSPTGWVTLHEMIQPFEE